MFNPALLFGFLIISCLLFEIVNVSCLYFGYKLNCDFSARFETTIIIISILFISLYLAPLGLVLLFAVLSILATKEFLSIAPQAPPLKYYLLLMTILYLIISFGSLSLFLIIIISIFLCSFFVPLPSYLPALIPLTFLSFVPAIYLLPVQSPTSLILFLLLVTQISDTVQYFIGKSFGLALIAPSISPNKTHLGFWAGFLSSIISGLLLQPLINFGYLTVITISIVLFITAFSGGLIMSAFKRQASVKDWGDCLPGHGGILDRIDGICFAGPVYFLTILLTII